MASPGGTAGEGPVSVAWLVGGRASVVESLPTDFTLADVYQAEGELAALHPGNSNVRPKIRQQLQCLRDAGWIVSAARGTYVKTETAEPASPP